MASDGCVIRIPVYVRHSVVCNIIFSAADTMAEYEFPIIHCLSLRCGPEFGNAQFVSASLIMKLKL